MIHKITSVDRIYMPVIRFEQYFHWTTWTSCFSSKSRYYITWRHWKSVEYTCVIQWFGSHAIFSIGQRHPIWQHRTWKVKVFADQCYHRFVWRKLLIVLAYHYCGIIMGAMAPQITRLTIVYPTVYSDTNQRKHQSSASLVFVRWIHRWPVNNDLLANVSIWRRHHDHRFVWRNLLIVLAYFITVIIIWSSTLWHIKFVSFCISSYPRLFGLTVEIKLYQNGHSFVTTLISNVVGNVNPAMYIIVTLHGHHEVSNHWHFDCGQCLFPINTKENIKAPI